MVGGGWVAVEGQRMRDVQFLMKQRPGNQKGDAKGGGKGKETDA